MAFTRRGFQCMWILLGRPAAQMAFDQISQRLDPSFIFVERWNVVIRTANIHEIILAFARFLCRFQAIGCKTGADNVELARAFLASCLSVGAVYGYAPILPKRDWKQMRNCSGSSLRRSASRRPVYGIHKNAGHRDQGYAWASRES